MIRRPLNIVGPGLAYLTQVMNYVIIRRKLCFLSFYMCNLFLQGKHVPHDQTAIGHRNGQASRLTGSHGNSSLDSIQLNSTSIKKKRKEK
jgi:hypothetical protein